ncbi:hypothetical protein [Saccharothrix syringae]|uniref:Uncharacterized protein n=1 Tax=Saccharothrix syringae TaxID=103733 RepID=A0A5Q0GRI4_SACSY|nr:hypothetical protein [Saccharothrix syringae]QFZ16558.1 hypothetical protein EKG83_02920 [Saccharothrix syringae]
MRVGIAWAGGYGVESVPVGGGAGAQVGGGSPKGGPDRAPTNPQVITKIVAGPVDDPGGRQIPAAPPVLTCGSHRADNPRADRSAAVGGVVTRLGPWTSG